MLSIETLDIFDTQYSADSVEWNNEKNIFVTGTYQLEERDENSSKATRKGRIYLFKVNDELKLEKMQQIETEAILDQKWYKENVLITATSLGKIQMFDFHNEKLQFNSELIIKEQEEENLALSIDNNLEMLWIAASDSQGQISIIDIENKKILNQWKAHEFEAWTCAFDRFNPNVLYSGGDDSKFNMWDIRSNVTKIKSQSRNAGVTSFLSYRENQIFVGSYDEFLSIYDCRNFKQSLSEVNLGGGVWRIKQANEENLLLVACMYHNFSIVDCSNHDNLKIIGEYNEHTSICYGCDWSRIKNYENYQIFASCSFYDHRLSLCRVKKL